MARKFQGDTKTTQAFKNNKIRTLNRSLRFSEVYEQLESCFSKIMNKNAFFFQNEAVFDLNAKK